MTICSHRAKLRLDNIGRRRAPITPRPMWPGEPEECCVWAAGFRIELRPQSKSALSARLWTQMFSLTIIDTTPRPPRTIVWARTIEAWRVRALKAEYRPEISGRLLYVPGSLAPTTYVFGLSFPSGNSYVCPGVSGRAVPRSLTFTAYVSPSHSVRRTQGT